MRAPNGGFTAVGSSFGSGVPVNPAARTRIAVDGANRRVLPCDDSGRSAAATTMSSSTQKPRPCVAMTMSSPCTSMSRTEVRGRFICSGCQCSPSSNDTYTPSSVAAYSMPRCRGSSRTALTKSPSRMPATIALPRPAAVARAIDVAACGRRVDAGRSRHRRCRASKCDASIMPTLDHASAPSA